MLVTDADGSVANALVVGVAIDAPEITLYVSTATGNANSLNGRLSYGLRRQHALCTESPRHRQGLIEELEDMRNDRRRLLSVLHKCVENPLHRPGNDPDALELLEQVCSASPYYLYSVSPDHDLVLGRLFRRNGRQLRSP